MPLYSDVLQCFFMIGEFLITVFALSCVLNFVRLSGFSSRCYSHIPPHLWWPAAMRKNYRPVVVVILAGVRLRP